MCQGTDSLTQSLVAPPQNRAARLWASVQVRAYRPGPGSPSPRPPVAGAISPSGGPSTGIGFHARPFHRRGIRGLHTPTLSRAEHAALGGYDARVHSPQAQTTRLGDPNVRTYALGSNTPRRIQRPRRTFRLSAHFIRVSFRLLATPPALMRATYTPEATA